MIWSAFFAGFLVGFLVMSFKNHYLATHQRRTRQESLTNATFPSKDPTQRSIRDRFPQDHT